MGFSTINGTGEMIYEGNNTWSFLYAATTSNSPVQPEIWHSADWRQEMHKLYYINFRLL